MLRFAVFALFLAVASSLELSASIHDHWTKFKSAHNKEYTSEEEQQRKEIFKQNVEKILSHNLNADLGEHSHRLAINEFADMTHEEFKNSMLGLRPDLANITAEADDSEYDIDIRASPASKDWTSYMGPVKNQGQCGSCWTFATTGALEGHWAIYKGEKVTLSEQNLVDCSDSSYNNHGCNGGLPMNAMKYILKNGGIDSDTCYKYEMREGTCRYQPSCSKATISNYKIVPYGRESFLQEAVGNEGPVTVGIDAGQSDFQLLGSGIYDSAKCTTTPNHAVVVVGYGSEGGKDYWIVKNSWGTSWGNRGYFKLAKGKNRCAVANLASYPIV